LFQQDHFGGERFQGALALQAGLPEVRTPVKETYYRAEETYYKAGETYYKAGQRDLLRIQPKEPYNY
jgi:hypothetical protein